MREKTKMEETPILLSDIMRDVLNICNNNRASLPRSDIFFDRYFLFFYPFKIRNWNTKLLDFGLLYLFWFLEYFLYFSSESFFKKGTTKKREYYLVLFYFIVVICCRNSF